MSVPFSVADAAWPIRFIADAGDLRGPIFGIDKFRAIRMLLDDIFDSPGRELSTSLMSGE